MKYKTFRKSICITIICTIFFTTLPVREAQCDGGILLIIREMTKRAIKALDLKVQRLQNKTIGLQNAQKALENVLSKLKLKEIGDWVQKQRDLYQKFYDELWKVRNTIATYQRIRAIIARQEQLVQEYKFTWHMANQDKHFTKDELHYMHAVYTGILEESIQNLEQILLVINSYKTKMSDAKRLEVINKAGDRIEQNYNDLQQFSTQAVQLSMMRAKDQNEINTVKKLYGL
jgi:hypothetical protein